jgi:glycosyltransferase involved in cell wall biosynthesis
MKKISYFISHPIQYQAPLLKYLHENLKDVDLEVVYFTKHTIGGLDKQFGVNIIWDIPLLQGYKYVFLKNFSLRPAVSGSFFGLVNFGVINYLIKRKPESIILHGWSYFSNILVLVVAKLLRIKIILRAESPLSAEENKSKINHFIKKRILGLCDRFLFIGKENKSFYEFMGIQKSQMFYAPYCVDNDRFIDAKKNFQYSTNSIRSEFNIPDNNTLLLFCGKLIDKKRPLDIVKALNQINSKTTSILYVGTGKLKADIENYVRDNKMTNVHFSGFVNQTELYKFYLSSDIFILPSTYGETWGLVVNEAMLHSLPILVSNHVGCVPDLVKPGENGYSYECGNIDDLKGKIEQLSSLNKSKLISMGAKSFEIIQNYSFKEVLKGVEQSLRN